MERDEFEHSWQPRLWIRVALLILIGAYLIAFVVGNDKEGPSTSSSATRARH